MATNLEMPENGCEGAPGSAYAGSDNRSGKQRGTREVSPAPAHPLLPLSRLGRVLGSPWQEQSKGLWPRRSREGQLCPGCFHCAPTHPCKASVTPLSTDTPGSLPRPSSTLHSPKLWAGFPPRKMAPLKYIFLHEDPPTLPRWKRGGGSLHPSAQGHRKAPVIPPQASVFHCVFPGRFDAQH